MLGVNIPALPASLRRTNQRTVVSLLLRLGCASRAELAKTAGISQPTAGKIISEMLDLGVLEEVSAHDSGLKNNGGRLGRPGQLLKLDENRARFVAIDLGVGKTRVSFLPVGVKLQDEWEHEFETPKTADEWAKSLAAVADKNKIRGLWGALVSVPGIVDEAGGRVIFSPNIHWLEKSPLAGLVKGGWDLPVALVQEMRVLAMGEMIKNPVRESFFIVDLGEGMGGGIVIRGQLFEHPIPLGGELGHTPVAGNHCKCGCGATGCLETLAGRGGLLRGLAKHLGKKSANWPELREHVEKNGAPPWLREILDAVARVVAGAMNVVGVKELVMTGILAELPPAVVKYLFGKIQDGALWGRFGAVQCSVSPRNRAAGLIAAGFDRLIIPAGDGNGILAAS